MLFPLRGVVDFKKKISTSYPVMLGLACLAMATMAPAQDQTFGFLNTITTVAGNKTAGYTGDGGPALSASFSATGTAAMMDPYGNLYITDTGNNVIRRVDAGTGIITTFAGGGTPGCANPSNAYGDGCLANQATLSAPFATRFYKGDIYIVDQGEHAIRRVSGATGIITTVAGNEVSAPPVFGNAATQSPLKNPQDIAFDSAGNWYILAAGGAPYVEMVDTSGIVHLYAGNRTAGKTGDGGPAISAELGGPVGLAMDNQGNLFISEASNNDVRKVYGLNAGSGLAGTIITYLGSAGTTTGSGTDGMTSDQFLIAGPQRISVDGAGNLYVAAATHGRLYRVAAPQAGAAFGVVSTVVGNGQTTGAGDGRFAQNVSLGSPYDVELTTSGDLLIYDRKIDAVRLVYPSTLFPFPASVGGTATTQTVYALTQSTAGTLTIAPTSTEFTAATSSCATNGNIAGIICQEAVTFQPTLAGQRSAPINFTDAAGTSVQASLSAPALAAAASLLPGMTSTFAGKGTAGNTGDGSAATAAQLHTPGQGVFDGQGNFYFADTANNEVRVISALNGNITRFAGTGVAGSTGNGGAATSATLNAPSGVAIDGTTGNLYIADTGNNEIRMVDSTGTISVIAGTGIAGFSGDGGTPAAAQLSGPKGLAISPAGVLYVADTGNNAIREIGIRSNTILTLAGTGVAGDTGDNSVPELATLNVPSAVALGANGVLYIADTGNSSIRQITTAGIISTFAGNGSAGFSGDGGPAVTAQFNAPSGLTVDAASDVYIADTGNNRVRLIVNGVVSTIVGTGTAGNTGDNGISSAATLNAPGPIALDATGDLLIADTANNTVRKVSVSADSFAFPKTSPMSSSPMQTFTLLNSGNQTLSVTGVAIPAAFSEVANGGSVADCNASGVTVAPASACLLALQFTPPSLGTYSGNFVITDNAENIAGTKQTIAVSGVSAYVYSASLSLPSTVVAGSSQSVTVNVTNPQSTYVGMLHFTSSDPQAVLPADYTYTSADAGHHTFIVQLRTTGIQTVTVTDTVDATITGSSSSTVTNGAANLIAVSSGSGQSSDITTAYPVPLVAAVTDVYGNPVPNAVVTFTAPTSGAKVTFSGSATATATTNIAGLATAPVMSPDGVTGSFSVVASTPGVAHNATFTLTNTSNVPPNFTLIPSPAIVASMLRGTSATVTVTSTPAGGFNGPITLACTGAAPTTSCSLSTTTLQPSGDGSSTSFQVTFTTKGPPHSQASLLHRSPFYAGVLFLCVGFGFCRRKRARLVLLTGLVSVFLFGAVGCSGSLSSTNAGYTPQGQYTVTVTGTSGSLTSSTVITYFVEGY